MTNTSDLALVIQGNRVAKFGGWTVERRHRGEPATGLYEYKVSKKDV